MNIIDHCGIRNIDLYLKHCPVRQQFYVQKTTTQDDGTVTVVNLLITHDEARARYEYANLDIVVFPAATKENKS